MIFSLIFRLSYAMIRITEEKFAKRVGASRSFLFIVKFFVMTSHKWKGEVEFVGKIEEVIWKLAEPLVAENGLELIDVEYVKEGAEWYLRLFLDKEGDEGIDLDDCELISRKFSDVLEEQDPITQAYRLEVSSPGIERPLKRTKDFQRFLGEKVQVKTFSEVEGKKQFIGILEEATEETVTVDVDGTMITIPRKQIGKANLVWEF